MDGSQSTLFANRGGVFFFVVCFFSMAFMVWVLIMWILESRRKGTKQSLHLRAKSRASRPFPGEQFEPAGLTRTAIDGAGERGNFLECTGAKRDRRNTSQKIMPATRLHTGDVSEQEGRATIRTRWRWLLMALVLAATTSLSAQTANSSVEIQQMKTLLGQLQTRVAKLESRQEIKQDLPQPSALQSEALTSADSGTRGASRISVGSRRFLQRDHTSLEGNHLDLRVQVCRWLPGQDGMAPAPFQSAVCPDGDSWCTKERAEHRDGRAEVVVGPQAGCLARMVTTNFVPGDGVCRTFFG
jgi:hypothetical protein